MKKLIIVAVMLGICQFAFADGEDFENCRWENGSPIPKDTCNFLQAEKLQAKKKERVMQEQKQKFELRGFKLGMSEREVLQNIEKLDANKKNIAPICKGSTETTITSFDRICIFSINMLDQDWSTDLRFFNDKLGSIYFEYKQVPNKEIYAQKVVDALKAKFGEPSSETMWIRTGQVLRVTSQTNYIVILLLSDASIGESKRRTKAVAKKNAEKL